MQHATRQFRIRMSRLAKRRAYPIQRCSLEAAFLSRMRLSTRCRFGDLPERQLLPSSKVRAPQPFSWFMLAIHRFRTIAGGQLNRSFFGGHA
jgi:hypothetical protein